KSSGAALRLPQTPLVYFNMLKPGTGHWLKRAPGDSTAIYLRRTDDALYAFPLQTPTNAQQARRAGGVAMWAITIALLVIFFRSLPHIISIIRTPRGLDFRAPTSLYLSAVVIIPLLIFVLFVRAYLANRRESAY